jgi:SWI/SNF-related matrix-associated actin-dependent regulator of chromatin subfamily A member 5
VAIKLPSRRELTLLVPLTRQQHELYRQYLCSLDSSTLEVVMREDTTEAARSNSQSSANLAATRDAVMTKITATSSGSSDQLVSASASSGAGAGNSNSNSGSSSADSDWRKLMNLLLQLRKICNHTYLLPDVAPEPYEITEDLVGGSGKLLVGMSNSGIVCFWSSYLCLVPRYADA